MFLGLAVIFTNCAEPKNNLTRVNTTPTFQDTVVENCVIQNFNTASKLQGFTSVFDSEKLYKAENETSDYVAIVNAECLNDPELKRRSRFSDL